MGILNTRTGELVVTYVVTLEAAKMLRRVNHQVLVNRYGQVNARLLLISEELETMMAEHKPDVCMVEDFFLGRNKSVQGFASLVRAQQTILMAAYHSAPTCDVKVIKPSVGKTAVGCPGNSGDKELVQKGVLTFPNTVFEEGTLDGLTEHSADALAQMMAYVKDFRKVHLGLN